jgi:hypothetical protein
LFRDSTIHRRFPMTTKNRYVVLHHTEIPDPHFDVMVQTVPSGPLRTWRSPTWPITEPTAVTPLADHRGVYLSYEGPLSGGRGAVRRVESGECVVDDLPDGAMRIDLPGGRSIHLSATLATPS